MSSPRQYEFATPAQWSACLFGGAEHESALASAGFTPHAPLTRTPTRLASSGAAALAMSPAGEILWRDDQGHLLRATANDEWAESFVAPWAVAQARRMVVTHDTLWVAGAAPGTLEAFTLDGLQRRQVRTLENAEIIDFAGDAHGALLVLIARQARHEIVHVDCGGDLTTIAVLGADLEPIQIANLVSRGRIVLLDADGSRLVAIERKDARIAWKRQLAAFRPCFVANALASDGRARIFVAGADGADFGGTPHTMVLDADAVLIDAVQLARPATGVTGGRGVVVISDAAGVAIHLRATVAGDSAPAVAELLTPLLRAPDSAAELRWQRVDAWSTLPEGTTLELRYGWIEDRELAARALAVQADARFSEAQRLATLLASIDHWSSPVVFTGSESRAGEAQTALSFPLHEASAPALWLHVTLRATSRAQLPRLSHLTVSYAGSPLLEQLPAIYRRNLRTPGDFIGAMVGTLEATTQDLDRRIAALGSYVHPDTAPVRWLDELAEWLGLPWDDAMSPAQKRSLLHNAGEFAAQRGTRAGLVTLLNSLFPGKPAPYRVSDLDVDFGFATLGGHGCRGSMLPSLLAGLPATTTVLSRRTILGRACLPARGAAIPSATARLSGRLRVDISAPAAAQNAARPWLARLIDSAVPAHLQVDLRWRTPARDHGSDGERVLASAPLPHLGSDAIAGFARLPPRPDSTLSS